VTGPSHGRWIMALVPWQKELIERGELYRVGGVVRGRIMEALRGVSHEAPDMDYLVRGIEPADLETILRRHGTVCLVGRVFGVYKFTPTGETSPIDIAYPRKEVSTGPGHREFTIDSDWRLPVEEDLARRDFTMNAIAENVATGERHDPFGGARDIERKLLRMVFPAAFAEDPLRILRGIRFAARFGLDIEPGTLAAMRESVRLIAVLSAERIQEEMTRILMQCDTPSRALALMHETGALAVVLPELEAGVGVEQNEFHPDDVFTHSVRACDAAPRGNLLVRWAALLHDAGKVAMKKLIEDRKTGEPRVVFYQHEEESARITRDVLTRLRYAKPFVARCESLVLNHMFNYEPEWTGAAVRRFMKKVGEENIADIFALRQADCLSRDLHDELLELKELEERINEELAKRSALTVERLAIGGNDVMRELGIGSGEAVGRILEDLLELVIDDPALNQHETLLGLLIERHKKK
jgi:tRNA nucleotidyltransferase (CCA-adding enzyme)